MASDAVPEVSVVIPVWDRHEALPRAVLSALRQEGVNHEVIVVDDGSTPPLDLGAVSDPRLTVVRHAVNRGAAAARNSGVAASRGAYVAFLDSDDLWHPRKLALQLAAARGADWRTAIGCGWKYTRGGIRHVVLPPDAAGLEAFAAGAWHGAGSTMLLSRRAIDAVGPQDEEMKRMEDYDWYLRFAASGGRLRVVGEPLVTIDWRPHGDWQEIDRACARLAALHLEPERALPKPVRRRIRAYACLIRASRRWHAGRRTAALWLLFRSWLILPRTTVFLDRPERRTE